MYKLPPILSCVWPKNFSKTSSAKIACKTYLNLIYVSKWYTASMFVFVVMIKADAVVIINFMTLPLQLFQA